MIAIIDNNGILSFFDMESRDTPGGQIGKVMDFEKKDVWNVMWSEDLPDQVAYIERGKLTILKNFEPEEPYVINGYICKFKDLLVTLINLEEISKGPSTLVDTSPSELIKDYESSLLLKAKSKLNSKNELKEGAKFIEENPHPQLWKLLAEKALNLLEFSIAEKAFVMIQDWASLQFLKRLKTLDDKKKQQAEI